MASTISNNKAINLRDLPIDKEYYIKNISHAFKNKYGFSIILTLSDKNDNFIRVWSTPSLMKLLRNQLGDNFFRLNLKKCEYRVLSYGLKDCKNGKKYFDFSFMIYMTDSDGYKFLQSSYSK